MALTLPLVVKANEQGFAPCDGGNCLILCVCVCVCGYKYVRALSLAPCSLCSGHYCVWTRCCHGNSMAAALMLG